ncbi:Clathrin light chain [Blastocladiella emersonii ATCC 22665]|nr:Clathrin light chain [Blastocladiella emersonii ATCC 22665]
MLWTQDTAAATAIAGACLNHPLYAHLQPTTMSDFGAFSSGDPTADFLARERAILGDDAAFVTGDMTGTTAAPAPVDFPDMSAFPPVDAFGDSAAAPLAAPVPTMASAVPADFFGAPLPSDSPAPIGVGAAVPLPSSPAPQPVFGIADSNPFGGAISPTPVSTSTTGFGMGGGMGGGDFESEAQRAWRESFQQTIAERDAAEARAKQETVAKAKADIDKFYEEYNAKREKALAESKALQDRMLSDINDTQSGTFWERVLKQIEVASAGSAAEGGDGVKGGKAGKLASNASAATAAKKPADAPKQKDVTRFKQVLLSLKADKATAPGA